MNLSIILNLLLHGKNTNRISDYDAICTFIAKLGLWQRRVQKGNAASFPNFDPALVKRNINLEGQLKLEIESHFQQLKQEFECYFPDLNDTELPIRKMTRNPFRTTEDILPDNLQEEFIKMIPQPKMTSKLCLSTSFGRNTCTFIRMLVGLRTTDPTSVFVHLPVWGISFINCLCFFSQHDLFIAKSRNELIYEICNIRINLST